MVQWCGFTLEIILYSALKQTKLNMQGTRSYMFYSWSYKSNIALSMNYIVISSLHFMKALHK